MNIPFEHVVEHIEHLLGGITISGKENVTRMKEVMDVLDALDPVLQNIGKAIKDKQQSEHDAEIERKRKEREQQIADAAAKGETIVGGQTVEVRPDGTVETVIP